LIHAKKIAGSANALIGLIYSAGQPIGIIYVKIVNLIYHSATTPLLK
jgi:hypothetical protein